MKMTLSGLLEVPEVCLARACLRRLSDPSDTLASAEICALGACEEPESWLADRLRWLATGEDDRRWGEATDPIVSCLARLREQSITQSPVEIVARVLNYIGIRPIVTAWGPDAIRAAQRQRNLDAFLDLAVEYENHCASQHEASRRISTSGSRTRVSRRSARDQTLVSTKSIIAEIVRPCSRNRHPSRGSRRVPGCVSARVAR